MLQSFLFWLLACFFALPFAAYPLSWGYIAVRALWITISNALIGPDEALYYAHLPETDANRIIDTIMKEDGYQALYWFTYPIRACIAIASLFYDHMKEK